MNDLSESSESDRLEQLLDQLIADSPAQLVETIRLGALPHWLDRDLAVVLFPRDEEAGASLNVLAGFRFVTEIAPGQIAYHDRVRQYLLGTWLADEPFRFKQLSERLAAYFLQRASQPDQAAKAMLPEWMYHLLAADPEMGFDRLAQLFERAVEARELGFAERLAAVALERRPLLDPWEGWLAYFPARLALANYEYEDARAVFSKLAFNGHDPALTYVAQRGLGTALLREKEWVKSIEQLEISIQGFKRLQDAENLVRSQLALGDAYRNLADSSGGIREARREFTGFLHFVLFVISRLPFFLYRRLAERVDLLPNLFGSNYQNWIVLRLLGLSARAYRRAEAASRRLGDTRIAVEARERLATVDFRLARYGRAERAYQALLEEPLVRASPYRTARVRLGLAQLALRRGDRALAREHLETSLQTFRRFGDWQRVGEAAYLLGGVFEDAGQVAGAVEAYATAIAATTRIRDFIARTEIAAALRRLVEAAGDRPQIDENQRERAESTLRQVDQEAYIARFPGRVQLWFTRLSQILGGPVLFLMALVLAILLGVTFIIIEGEALILAREDPGLVTLFGLGFRQALIVVLAALTPLFALWIRYGLYVILGWLIVRFFLPLTRVEASQPDRYVLDDAGITKVKERGVKKESLAWDAMVALIYADRCIWRLPNPLISKTLLSAGDRPMVISGATNRYQELQRAVEARLDRSQPEGGLVRQCSMSILNHWWLWAALVLALVLGPLLVSLFLPGLLSYCPEVAVGGECPVAQIPLVLAPRAVGANIMFVLLFTAGTLVRLAKAWVCVVRESRLSAPPGED